MSPISKEPYCAHSFSTPSSLLRRLFSRIPPEGRLVLIFLLFIIVPLTLLLLLLRRFAETTLYRPQGFAASSQDQTHSKDVERLQTTWPPVSLVALAPELASLPNPTIRCSSSTSANMVLTLPGQTDISAVKTRPVAGRLFRRETMGEVNGCRRHVVIFGSQG